MSRPSDALHELDESSKQEWQLIDDSAFIATIDPWPARQGAATLRAEATEDDGEQKFDGTVEFRVAQSRTNSEPWQPMRQVREDEYGSLYFEAPITLKEGTSYVQFRVQDAGDPQPTELLDWAVEVK